MRLTLALILSALIAPFARGQSVDEVRGFRNFEFGSTAKVLPATVTVIAAAQVPKLMVARLPGTDLKESQLFGQRIEFVDFQYWGDRLFYAEISLSPIDCGISANAAYTETSGPETDAYFSLFGNLKAAYGKPDQDEANYLCGRYDCTWNGKTVSANLYGHRTVKDGRVRCEFTLTLRNLPILRAMQTEQAAQAKDDVSKRKDGL